MRILVVFPHDTLLEPQGALERMNGIISSLPDDELIPFVPRTASRAAFLKGKHFRVFDEPQFAGRRVPHLLDYSRGWLDDLRQAVSVEQIDLALFHFPWGISAASNVLDIPLVYFSHGVERDFARITLRHIGLDAPLIRAIATRFIGRLERAACLSAALTVTISAADARRMCLLYGRPIEKFVTFPQPVVIEEAPFDRNAARARLGIENETPLVVFHGSYSHLPNREAVAALRADIIPRLRVEFPNLQCLVAGGGVPSFSDPGIRSAGFQDDLAEFLRCADVAAIPISSGCGVRMKLFDYFRLGVPCVSTEKGAEGLEVRDGRELLLSSDRMDEFSARLAYLLRERELQQVIAENAREYLLKNHDPARVASRLRSALVGLCQDPDSERTTAVQSSEHQ